MIFFWQQLHKSFHENTLAQKLKLKEKKKNTTLFLAGNDWQLKNTTLRYASRNSEINSVIPSLKGGLQAKKHFTGPMIGVE